MMGSLGFLRSCGLFYHYLSDVATPAELSSAMLLPEDEFSFLARYLALPTSPRWIFPYFWPSGVKKSYLLLRYHYVLYIIRKTIFITTTFHVVLFLNKLLRPQKSRIEIDRARFFQRLIFFPIDLIWEFESLRVTDQIFNNDFRVFLLHTVYG